MLLRGVVRCWQCLLQSLFPALWALARFRISAAAVAAGYFLAASHGFPQGVTNFYGSGFEAGIALWLGASLSFVIVHAVLWTSRPGWRGTLHYGATAVLMCVPSFGIVGWAHPITGAGVIFPGWGWVGFIAAAIGLLAMTTRLRLLAILTLGGLWIWSAATWIPPRTLQGWVGVDTNFSGAEAYYADYRQQLQTIELVRAAADSGVEVIVLPEGAVDTWTPTVERLWMSALRDLDLVVNAGAIVVDPDGYDNTMLELTASGGQVLYRERMPVPVSMWQPWLAWTGQGGGARAHFFANPVIELGGMRVAPLICYEQLIIWPVLQSVFHSPDVIVATGMAGGQPTPTLWPHGARADGEPPWPAG